MHKLSIHNYLMYANPIVHCIRWIGSSRNLNLTPLPVGGRFLA